MASRYEIPRGVRNSLVNATARRLPSPRTSRTFRARPCLRVTSRTASSVCSRPMRSCAATERARPLLGTRVAIRVEGLAEAAAHRAIDEAFEHRDDYHLMSFHVAKSDVSLQSRGVPWRGRDQSSDSTFTGSGARPIPSVEGCFDITIAPELVACGCCLGLARSPDPAADWRNRVWTRLLCALS